MTGNLFKVRAINPANGQMIELIIVADGIADAKHRAEQCGLRMIIVTPEPPSTNPPGRSGDPD